MEDEDKQEQYKGHGINIKVHSPGPLSLAFGKQLYFDLKQLHFLTTNLDFGILDEEDSQEKREQKELRLCKELKEFDYLQLFKSPLSNAIFVCESIWQCSHTDRYTVEENHLYYFNSFSK